MFARVLVAAVIRGAWADTAADVAKAHDSKREKSGGHKQGAVDALLAYAETLGHADQVALALELLISRGAFASHREPGELAPTLSEAATAFGVDVTAIAGVARRSVGKTAKTSAEASR